MHHNERSRPHMGQTIAECDCDTPDLCGSQGYCGALRGRLPSELHESDAERVLRRLSQISALTAACAVGVLLLHLAWRALS